MTDKELELENRFRRIENKVNAMSFLSLANLIILSVFILTNL